MTKAIRSLDDVIEALHEIFAHDDVCVDSVFDVLKAYKSNPADWTKFAKWDTHRYTRNLVDEGNGKFNLMILCWGEGMGSSIHDHSDAHCFVKMLSGTLREALYDWPVEGAKNKALKLKAVNTYETNGVTYINDTIGLHRVENPSHTEGAVSLHLYSPPFDACRTFDERTGQTHTCKVTFWSRFGERTAYQLPSSCVPDQVDEEPKQDSKAVNLAA